MESSDLALICTYSVLGGICSTKEQWQLPSTSSPERTVLTPAPPAHSVNLVSSAPPCISLAFWAASLSWSSRRVSLWERLCVVPLRLAMSRFPAAHLTQLQSLLVFRATRYESSFLALESWAGKPCVGLGPLAQGGCTQLSSPSHFLTTTRRCGACLFCISSCLPNLDIGFFFIFLVIRLLFSSSSGDS